jgi:hypothetical protein
MTTDVTGGDPFEQRWTDVWFERQTGEGTVQLEEMGLRR